MRLPHAEAAAAGSRQRRHALAWASRLALLAMLPCATQVHAQATPALTFSPYASAQETLTDNYDLSRTDKVSDAVTRLTAGVSVRSRSGRVRGFLDYSLSGLVFVSHSERNGLQNQLSADLDAEWFERQGFLRATASIQQSAVSAFGAAPRADGVPNNNSTELRTITLAPRWQGFLGSGLRVNLQGQGSYSNASDKTLGSVSSGLLSAHVEPTNRATVSWALDALSQESGYAQTGSTQTSRAYGTLYWLLSDLDLRLSADAGRERSNLSSLQTKDSNTWGLGLQWAPSARTKLTAQLGQRSFGKTHLVSLEYRTARTVWIVSDSRNINTDATSLGVGQQGRAFDLLFAQFASIEPDFAKRQDLVAAYLATNGLSPNAILSSSFLRTAATIDDRLEFSTLWRGPRTTAALSYTLSTARQADTGTVTTGDLTQASRVRQRIFGVALSHRLTPELTASLTANYQTANGTLTGQASSQRGLTAQLGGQLGPKDNWTLAARLTRYETSLVPYSENALIATYGLRF